MDWVLWIQIFAFSFLDKITPTKQIIHLVKAKKPHAPMMNVYVWGGGCGIFWV